MEESRENGVVTEEKDSLPESAAGDHDLKPGISTQISAGSASVSQTNHRRNKIAPKP